jgi:hypothetical protein
MIEIRRINKIHGFGARYLALGGNAGIGGVGIGMGRVVVVAVV